MAQKLLLASGFAIAFGLSFGPALSQDTKSVSVHYGDLDLRSDAGVDTLNGRLRNAIRIVCGGWPAGGTLEWTRYVNCKTEARGRVQPLRDAVILAARENRAPTNVATLAVVASPGAR